jgi:hypothetical protein
MASSETQPVEGAKDERMFHGIASGSTALALGTAFGALACLEWKTDGSLDFRWHAMALVWIAVGIAAALLFWSTIWRADAGSARSKGRAVWSYVVLIAATLANMVYSLRTLPKDKLSDVYVGLGAAVVALGITGFMIRRAFHWFLDSDAGNKSEEDSR